MQLNPMVPCYILYKINILLWAKKTVFWFFYRKNLPEANTYPGSGSMKRATYRKINEKQPAEIFKMAGYRALAINGGWSCLSICFVNLFLLDKINATRGVFRLKGNICLLSQSGVGTPFKLSALSEILKYSQYRFFKNNVCSLFHSLSFIH